MAPPADPQLQLTRGHLYALGSLSLALALLAFFVGLQTGRNEAPPPASPTVSPLVSAEARSGDLEVLLAKVEQANAPAERLAFPAELPKSEPPPTPLPPADPAAPPPPVEPVAAPVDPFPAEAKTGTASVAPSVPASMAQPLDGVPASGWAIQVASRADENDAQVLVETLRAAGLAAYRGVALVDGATTWRIRVGGYASKDAATAAMTAVASRAGSTDPRVLPAP